ncbi:MAG: substrate-binding domain-containing protein [Vicinamibacterales bacterium]
MRRPVLAIVVMLAACAPAARPAIDIATTTSVQNSGLLDYLLLHFEDAQVRVHAAGSGRSLEMLADGVVDLVISHAPETEARYLATHADWRYRKLASNWFIIVGPSNDPARIRDAADALDAFRRIAAAPVPFVSRGDESGTHEREQAFWRAAGVEPDPGRLIVSGRGMAQALRHADEINGYTLSDDATFRQLQPQLDLIAFTIGDARLLNTYAVIHPKDDARAATFAEWSVTGNGRDRIAEYRIDGRVAFAVWPHSCPGYTPDARPCETPPR